MPFVKNNTFRSASPHPSVGFSRKKTKSASQLSRVAVLLATSRFVRNKRRNQIWEAPKMSAQTNLSANPFAIANSTSETASKQTCDNRPFFFASQTAVVTFAKRLKASRTGAMKNFLVLLFLLGVTSVFACDVNAQLLYTTFNNSNQTVIRQTNLTAPETPPSTLMV